MNRDALSDEAILRADFARRVVERVRKAKRRRRLYWSLTSAAASILATWAFFSLPARNLARQPPTTSLAVNDNRHPGAMELGGPLKFNSPSFYEPLTFFVPSASTIPDFQSSEAAYWHSYDSWWVPEL